MIASKHLCRAGFFCGSMDGVIDVLLEYLPLGAAVRLAAVDIGTRQVVMENRGAWVAFSRAAQWSRFHGVPQLMRRLAGSKRCRECGRPRGLSAATRAQRTVYVCAACQREEGGYSEMVSRVEMRELLRERRALGFAPTYAALLRDVGPCRQTRNSAFLYWKAEVLSRMG